MRRITRSGNQGLAKRVPKLFDYKVQTSELGGLEGQDEGGYISNSSEKTIAILGKIKPIKTLMNSIDLEVPIGKEKDQLTLPFGTLVNLGLFGNGVLRLKWVQMCHLQKKRTLGLA